MKKGLSSPSKYFITISRKCPGKSLISKKRGNLLILYCSILSLPRLRDVARPASQNSGGKNMKKIF